MMIINKLALFNPVYEVINNVKGLFFSAKKGKS